MVAEGILSSLLDLDILAVEGDFQHELADVAQQQGHATSCDLFDDFLRVPTFGIQFANRSLVHDWVGNYFSRCEVQGSWIRQNQ